MFLNEFRLSNHMRLAVTFYEPELANNFSFFFFIENVYVTYLLNQYEETYD